MSVCVFLCCSLTLSVLHTKKKNKQDPERCLFCSFWKAFNIIIHIHHHNGLLVFFSTKPHLPSLPHTFCTAAPPRVCVTHQQPPHNDDMTTVHPVLTLINRCDQLAQQFDATFAASCTLLTDLSNGQSSKTLEETLMVLRSTLDECEQVVGAMLACIYEDIPHLLDMLDRDAEAGAQAGGGAKGLEGVVGNWNPKQALDGISQLFYVGFHLFPPSFARRDAVRLPSWLRSVCV